MFLSWLKKASLAVLAGVASLAVTAGSANAGSIALGNSGWTATWVGHDGDLALTADFQSSDSVFIEKFVTFRPSDVDSSGAFINPVVINFQQTSANAVPFIVINDEVVVNKTGKDWNGFRFTILDGLTGSSQDVQFDLNRSQVGQPGGFSIDPFTNSTASQNNQILELGGGTVPSAPPGPVGPNVWFPGVNSGGLAIHVTPDGTLRSFTLKETPLIGPPTVIPLPTAAWSGLSGLLGLALIGARKQLRKIVA